MADTYTGAVTVGGPPERRDLGALVLDKVQVGPLENNAYFLECKETGDVLLIDAAHSPDVLLGVLDGRRLQRIVTTHSHPDHWQALPEVLAATDHALTPPELLLVALAGCITGTIASVAQHRGIQLRSVRAHVEGDVDVAGILGIDPEVRDGFSAIRLGYDIDADATRVEVEALVAQAQKRSAVYDVVTNPTSVVVTVR